MAQGDLALYRCQIFNAHGAFTDANVDRLSSRLDWGAGECPFSGVVCHRQRPTSGLSALP